jgi:hypothetical protein
MIIMTVSVIMITRFNPMQWNWNNMSFISCRDDTLVPGSSATRYQGCSPNPAFNAIFDWGF